MSTKIAIDEVANILKAQKLEPSQIREIVEAMNEATQPDADEDIKPPQPKHAMVCLLSDPTGAIKADTLVGWVLSLPEDQSPATILERVNSAAHSFNGSRKGKMHPVATVGEALESVSPKYFKAVDVKVRTKSPCYFIKTTNQLTEAPSV